MPPQLLTTIKNLLDQARKQVVQTVNLTMVKTYFEIGKMIVEDEQNGENRAEYGKEILKAPANAENGLRVNKSGVASYKFRGNVVERFLTYLCHESEQEDLAVKSPASPF